MARRTSGAHFAEIMALAPLVITMRMPTLAAEAMTHGALRPETTRAVSEKAAAMAEGALAMQTSLIAAGMKTWFAWAGGRIEPRALAAAQEAAMLAALSPVSRRVRANVKRLSR